MYVLCAVAVAGALYSLSLGFFAVRILNFGGRVKVTTHVQNLDGIGAFSSFASVSRVGPLVGCWLFIS